MQRNLAGTKDNLHILVLLIHHDVIKSERILHYWPFMSPSDSPRQRGGALLLFFLCQPEQVTEQTVEGRWIEMYWRSFYITVMWCGYFKFWYETQAIFFLCSPETRYLNWWIYWNKWHQINSFNKHQPIFVNTLTLFLTFWAWRYGTHCRSQYFLIHIIYTTLNMTKYLSI